MERVSFLIEETNQRIGCLLNPESIVMRRSAGVQPRRLAGGHLTGAGLTDDPLFYTGGGRTELELDLLFDVWLAGSSIATEDVRDLTAAFWNMAENAIGSDGYRQPRVVRFVWGKSWNIPGIVVAVAERFEQFTDTGIARRSWLRLRMIRVNETLAQPDEIAEPIDTAAFSEEAMQEQEIPEETQTIHECQAGERLDEIAFRYYGNPALWRLIAAFNGIANPADIPPGTVLRIPPLPGASAVA